MTFVYFALDFPPTQTNLKTTGIIVVIFDLISSFFSLPSLVGQRHVPDSGCEEFDERCGVHSEGLLRCFDQIPEIKRHGGPQHAGHLLEDESSREEASGEEGEAG